MSQIPIAPDACAFISYIVHSAYRMLFVKISFMFSDDVCLIIILPKRPARIVSPECLLSIY